MDLLADVVVRAPARLASGLSDLAATIDALGGPHVDGPTLAAERSVLQGLGPPGRVSAGGACELVPTADGWLAVNLPRATDRELLPAWLEDDTDDWRAIVATHATAHLIERATLLGLAVATPSETTLRPGLRRPSSFSARPGLDSNARRAENLRVVDLTSMWAGPLCARLLGMAGADVVKVEDPRRPDAAREGAPELFRRLHEGHRIVEAAIDSAEVRDLVLRADVVLEAARPRALPQVGLDRDAIAAETGCVWVAITGHGLEGGDRAAFGDDAAVAGGLVGWADDGPVFCGDALADPVTGLFASVGALEALRRGGPWVVDAGLAPCAAELARAH
jgi:hypothetical protein